MEMRKGFAREKAKRYRQGSQLRYMELVRCTRHHADGRCAAGVSRCGSSTLVDRSRSWLAGALTARTARISQQTVAALQLWRHFGYLCGTAGGHAAALCRLRGLERAQQADRAGGARQAAAHQCDHRPGARRETHSHCALSHTHRNADVANSDPHLQRVATCRSAPSGWIWSVTTVAVRRASLPTPCHRPLHAMDGDARGAHKAQSSTWWCAACSPSSCWESTRITAENYDAAGACEPADFTARTRSTSSHSSQKQRRGGRWYYRDPGPGAARAHSLTDRLQRMRGFAASMLNGDEVGRTQPAGTGWSERC